MRAVQVTRFGGPEVLEPTDLPDPEPAAGQVVVDVAAAEILFVDTQLRTGWGRDWFPLTPPYVPGVGVAGTVRSLGEGVDPSLLGRRVIAGSRAGNRGGYFSGGYAERAAVTADDVYPVPDGLALPEALAALHDGLTAVRELDIAALRPGDRVLVTAAAGSLGTWLIPLATAAGATVYAAAHGGRKLAQARALGAAEAVDYSEPRWTDRIRSLAGGVDVVFDGAGGEAGRAAFDVTADNGRFLSYGAASGTFAEFAADRRGITVRGLQDPDLPPLDWRALTERALDHLAAGYVHPVIGQTFPLEKAADAHTAIDARATIGKTVLLT